MTSNLPDAQARALITGTDPAGLDQTLFVEAGAGSGKTGSLVARVLALVDAGVELRHITAITFTEKAAAELRDRIRVRLEAAHRDAADETARARYRTALEQVDMAALSTLHSFAQRILTEFPLEAGLPPNVELLDEVSSEVEFEERWREHRDQVLGDDELAEVVQLAMAAGMKFPRDIRQLALEFERNWDLATDPDRVPWAGAGVPRVDVTALIDALDAAAARRHDCRNPDNTLALALEWHVQVLADELRAAPDDAARLRLLDPERRLPCPGSNGEVRDQTVTLNLNKGAKGEWPAGVKDELVAAGYALMGLRDRTRQDAVDALLHRLAVSVGQFVGAAARDRVRQGRLEFHDLLVLARRLLRGPSGPTVRRALRGRYQRLLLDEFQDTDPIQVELAVLLAAGDPQAGRQRWSDTATDPGRLFFVGDPKQSIYRFRRADIGLFLEARSVFADGQALTLTTNFRTSPAVIAWINHVFGQLIRFHEGSQPAYEPLDPSPTREDPPAGPVVAVVGQEPHPYGTSATGVREREAAEVADVVVRAVADRWQVADRVDDRDAWRPATFGDITILLPARTSLPMLEDALSRRGIPYRAESSSLVYATREVRDLMLTVRALADPSDQLALVAALRSHLFGCSDADLVTWKVEHQQALHLLAPRDEDAPANHPVGLALDYLRALHDQLVWLAPADLLDRLCRDRQLFELGHATRRPRDVWRRLRFVIDQARAWTESEGGSIRQYLAWARLQASDSARVAETILPETDDDSVRIMTVHAAKGLEFPITILSGTSSRPGGRQHGVQVVWPPTGPVGIRLNARVTSEEFDAFQPVDEQMGHDERLRLLYVACTRARDHLVVSLHRAERKHPAKGRGRLTSAELLAEATASVSVHAWDATGGGAATPLPAPPAPALQDRDAWLADRDRALQTAGRPRTIGATGVQELLVEVLDPGDDKAARDLDLPAWNKGRYGTAIGRAVHGVLQTVDLTTGEGVANAAAAQAAAEGVVGREADVEVLARSALSAPVVQQAARAPERWRETYVAVPLGERVLEGYIDLAFRSLEGLVVVDYKTASSADDLDQRLAHYRGQGGAYALAMQEATGEPVARVVLVFLTPRGAIERELPDLADAVSAVRAAMGAPA